MDIDRHSHRSTSNISSTATTTTTATTVNATSELFICFNSRLYSSSSMKLPSKSILSPGRARDSSQISLSTSLSRRLRNSGSIKGGQASPMFPAAGTTSGKKRGCSFENPEPSSPKVTCIGQVRVKTKKQGKKMRAARSRREVSSRRTEQAGSTNGNNGSHNSSLGDANHYQDYQFQQSRECLRHRNQRWVHLPVTICEALRAFGAEFNCFLPCRSSCMASNDNGGDGNNKLGKVNHQHRSESTSGAAFARWLVAEKIELVVGGEAVADQNRHGDSEEQDGDDDEMPRRSRRRHVLEDIVIDGDKCELKNEIFEEEASAEEEEETEGRVSICVPPKNALLLMRCRSDPVKMAALANRFWECPPPQDEEAEGEEQEQEQEAEARKRVNVEQIVEEAVIRDAEAEAQLEAQGEAESKEVNGAQEEEVQKQEQQVDDRQVLEQEEYMEEATAESYPFTVESLADPETEENVANLLEENENILEDETELTVEKEEAFEDDIENKWPSFSSPFEVPFQEAEVVVAETEAEDSTEQEEEDEEEEAKNIETTHEGSEPEEPETGQESKEVEAKNQNLLPDCLLLMMCEPKLSMEVSKETWVCSTDFIRWQPAKKKPPLPPQTVNKTVDGCDEEPKKRVSIDLIKSKPSQQQHQKPPQQQLLMQPPRSSCSFPAAPPLPPALGAPSMKTMNKMIEQKLVGARRLSYEPFSLTRCKSEPRKPSAKLAPQTCFWKNRKIEPHRPGIGTAGVGF